jgi:hypothetical protein
MFGYKKGYSPINNAIIIGKPCPFLPIFELVIFELHLGQEYSIAPGLAFDNPLGGHLSIRSSLFGGYPHN